MSTTYYRHGLRPMLGRDRGENRAASPLELLYDLAFVEDSAWPRL